MRGYDNEFASSVESRLWWFFHSDDEYYYDEDDDGFLTEEELISWNNLDTDLNTEDIELTDIIVLE